MIFSRKKHFPAEPVRRNIEYRYFYLYYIIEYRYCQAKACIKKNPRSRSPGDEVISCQDSSSTCCFSFQFFSCFFPNRCTRPISWPESATVKSEHKSRSNGI